MPEVSEIIKILKTPEGKQAIRKILGPLQNGETLHTLLDDLKSIETDKENIKALLNKIQELALLVQAMHLNEKNVAVF